MTGTVAISWGPGGVFLEHAAKTHCPQGHPYEGDNLYIIPTTGSRSCKACHAVASRKYKARQREARRKDAA